MAIKDWASEKNNHAIRYNDAVFAGPSLDFFDPTYWQSENKVTGNAKGRGTTYFIEHESRHWVLRHYRRGGLIGKVLTDEYLYGGLGSTRAFAEFDLLHRMRELGLPVPEPVAAHVSRHGLFYRADLITAMIPDSQDLHNALCHEPLDAATWERVGETIARFHKAQVYHHDLNIHNIMRDGEGTIWLIDFDRCAIRDGDGWKQEMLDRLQRSLEKELGRCETFHFSSENWQQLLRGYERKIRP